MALVTRLLERWVIAPALPEKTTPVDWLAGASMLIRREVFDSIGLIDEGYFLYFEETDFCLRAARRNWPTAYVAESISRPRRKRFDRPTRYLEANAHLLVRLQAPLLQEKPRTSRALVSESNLHHLRNDSPSQNDTHAAPQSRAPWPYARIPPLQPAPLASWRYKNQSPFTTPAADPERGESLNTWILQSVLWPLQAVEDIGFNSNA